MKGLLLSTADTHHLKYPLNAKMLAMCIIRSSGQRERMFGAFMNHVKLKSLLMATLSAGAKRMLNMPKYDIAIEISILPCNCRGLRLGQSAVDEAHRIIVDQLLEHCDILCLQETFLAKQDLKKLNSISESFHGAGESTTDLSLGIKRVIIPGGVAILWNKKLDSAINVIRLGVVWCIAIHFTQRDKELIILNTYTPYECQHNEEDYVNKRAFISSYLQNECFTIYNIFIAGDMNADISDKRSIFANHLNHLCTDNNLILSSRELLPAESYTHISETWHTTSWLDHCLSTADAHASFAHMEILYNVSTSDHIPVKMVIRSEYIPATVKCANNSNLGKLDWSSHSCEDIACYCKYTDQLLSNIYLSRKSLIRKNGNCTNTKHKTDISAMYTYIVSALL